MEWKNLHFVWKQFLSNSNIPSVIYSNTLKTMFKDRFSYSEDSDSFIGITSKYLPIQSDFIKFWETTITNTGINNMYVMEGEPVSDFEIDEICSLFKLWSKQNSEELLTNGNITEETVLKILKHFFHNIEIIEETTGMSNLIMPKLRPFEAISWLSNYARPQSTGTVGADMLFFETKNGFNFRSLQSMYKDDVYATYKYQAKNIKLIG
jgi:hypothetical protein